VEEQQESLKTKEGRKSFAREFGDRLTTAVGDEIDRIENDLRERHPELQYLDLESD
jgi:hypothetical protein